MSLYVRLLGPVRLYRQGRAVTVTAIKQLALLAALALNQGQPVDLDSLMEAVWSDPPRSAVANLRNYAGALRQNIGDRLSTVPGGYQLTLSTGELDVRRFREAVEAGRRLAGPDPAGAERSLAEALELWQGDPGQGLPPGTSLESEWAMLRSERLTAFEDLVDVRLGQGRHDSALPALHGHLHRHPLRERAWGQLMLALYRSGDTAGALRAYTDARSATREQLGIDPGSQLAELQRQILRRSPTLDLRRPGPATGEAVRVRSDARHRLPAESGTFAGRRAEIGELLRQARLGKHTAVVVHGPAGVGKSALVQHTARQLLAEYPDGVAYLDNRWWPPEQPGAGPGDLLGRALRALGSADSGLHRIDERAEALRDLLGGRRVLLIADNMVRADQVRSLIPPESGSLLMVTSRSPLPTLDQVGRVGLTPVSERDALAILAAYAGRDRVTAALGAAHRIVRLCDHLPLALRIVGTQLAQRTGRSLDRAADRLADPAYRLDALEHHDLSVRGRFESAYATVQPAAAELFVALPDLPEQVSPQMAAQGAGVPTGRAWSALETLADVGLLEAADDDRYRLSGLPRCFGVELASHRSGR